MSLVLDLACIILIFVMAVRGYKKGLVKGLFGVVSFVVAGVISAIIYKPVSSYIVSLPFVKDKIILAEEKIQTLLGSSQQETMSSLPEWMFDVSNKAVAETNATLSSAVVNILVSVLSIIIVYILVKLALRLFEGILEVIMKLPVLNLLNRVGGTACGVVSATVVLWIILAMVVLFAGTVIFAPVNDAVQTTNILKYFYNNNLLIKFIMN